jgi:hypothetical protein
MSLPQGETVPLSCSAVRQVLLQLIVCRNPPLRCTASSGRYCYGRLLVDNLICRRPMTEEMQYVT